MHPLSASMSVKIYNNCNPDINECSNNQDFIIKNGYGKMILIKIRN